MTRTNQGGSVLGFVVVAAIMAGLLIGGVYAVRQLTAASQQGTEPPKTAEEKPAAEQKKPEAQKSDEKADEPTTESTPPASSSPSVEPTDELPQTGPSENLVGAVFMLAILSATVVSYARSRRVELAL